MVDKHKFQRLFELLLKDEIVSLPEGSVITLSAVQKSEGDRPIEFVLTDDGPGLPKEALRLIFDPFALRSDSPLEYGINLMAVYFIVHHHGGKIEARSEEGRGTSFYLTFPVNCDQPQKVEENQQFLEKVLLNESLWEKLLTAE
jgi:signal transduction histidine kinase